MLEYAPPSAGIRATSSTSPPTSSTCSRDTSGEKPHALHDGRQRLGPGQGGGHARRVRDTAVELVKLLSARMSARGHAFGPDTPWQRELEEAFPFAETPDQLAGRSTRSRPTWRSRSRWIASSPATSASARPRSPCARRGSRPSRTAHRSRCSFRRPARQAAPRDFTERFAGSRSRSVPSRGSRAEKEAKETLAGLLDGSIDMVFGHAPDPHREGRLQEPGLLIIDEEQRFGVELKDA